MDGSDALHTDRVVASVRVGASLRKLRNWRDKSSVFTRDVGLRVRMSAVNAGMIRVKHLCRMNMCTLNPWK